MNAEFLEERYIKAEIVVLYVCGCDNGIKNAFGSISEGVFYCAFIKQRTDSARTKLFLPNQFRALKCFYPAAILQGKPGRRTLQQIAELLPF